MMLEQEIEKYLSGQTLCNCDSVSYRNIKNLILGFAEPREKRIEELTEQNTSLLTSVENLNKSVQELEKENAELKEQISTKDILIKELQEQKVYWKESSFDWRHKFFKLDKVKRLVKKDKQLTKAKDLLLRFIELKNKPCASGHSINMLLYENICAETEQFLKGNGCTDCFCEDCTKKDCKARQIGLVEKVK